MLHHKKPDYGSFRMLGSRCYPYMWDQKTNKFDTKSLPYVFLGYSDHHKGYRCYYPPTRRTIISRHVVFDEAIFPFNKAVTNCQPQPEPMVTTSQEWASQRSSPTPPHPMPVHHPPEVPTPNSLLSKSIIISHLLSRADNSTEEASNAHLSLAETPSLPSLPVPSSVAPPPPSSSHAMQTSAKFGIRKPNPKYALLHDYTAIPKEPKTVQSALKHPGGDSSNGRRTACLGSKQNMVPCSSKVHNEYRWVEIGVQNKNKS